MPDSPALPARCTVFLRPALRRADCRCWPERTITFSARWSCRRARPVARRVLCAVPRVALRAPCAVPDVVLRAQRVVPDAAPYQTSASQWTAWRAWCWSGLQQVTPSELQASPQVQTQPRTQKEQERCDDRPASVPNVHPCQAPGLLPSCTSHKFQRVGIDPNQPGRWQQSVSRTAIGSGGRVCRALAVTRVAQL